jgi:hypothetical protein
MEFLICLNVLKLILSGVEYGGLVYMVAPTPGV